MESERAVGEILPRNILSCRNNKGSDFIKMLTLEMCVCWMYDIYIGCLLLTHLVSLKKLWSFLVPLQEFFRPGSQFILTTRPWSVV